jgi:hypothetical protein
LQWCNEHLAFRGVLPILSDKFPIPEKKDRGSTVPFDRNSRDSKEVFINICDFSPGTVSNEIQLGDISGTDIQSGLKIAKEKHKVSYL